MIRAPYVSAGRPLLLECDRLSGSIQSLLFTNLGHEVCNKGLILEIKPYVFMLFLRKLCYPSRTIPHPNKSSLNIIFLVVLWMDKGPRRNYVFEMNTSYCFKIFFKSPIR